MINTSTHNYHNFPKSNTYYIQNLANKNNPLRVKKIQSQNCNRNILERILLKNIKLDINTFYYIQNNHLYIKHLKNLLKGLKSSGYISCIKIFNINTKNDKYFTLNITINPVIKKIVIMNYKKLKIPSYFLKKIFDKHVGMPRNYHLINESFNSIYLWYKSRGFVWISIEFIEQEMIDTNNITFNIIEGIVKDVKLTCRTKNIYNPKLLNILHSLIKQELGIYSGSILNLNKIEKGIKHLINLHLIQSCNYIIKRDKTKFIVTIKYDICKNKISYSYNYSSILKNYSNYRQIYNLLCEYLTHFKFFIRYTQKSRIFSSIMQIDQSLSYKYKSFYHNHRINSFFTNLAIIKNCPQLNIIFSHPYIQKQNKTFAHLRMNLSNIIIKTHLCHPSIILNLNGLIISQKSNLFDYLYKYIFSIKYNLLNSITMLQKGWLVHKKLIQINLCVKSYQLKKYTEIKSFKQTSLININKLLKYIKYQLIYLQLSIKHNNLYIWNRPKTGQFIHICSKIFTYIEINHDRVWYKLMYLGQSIRIKYIKVFNLPKICQDIYYHVFLIFSECHFSINSIIYEPMIYRSSNQADHIFFKENQPKKSPLYFFYIFNIEYHISKIKYLSIYCFCNHITYSGNEKQQKSYIRAIHNIYKYNTQIGSGIKFYIPIKKLPNLKLEYSIDNKGKYFLRLLTDSKYNE